VHVALIPDERGRRDLLVSKKTTNTIFNFL